MTCPNCSGALSDQHVRADAGATFTVCPDCARTLVIDGSGARLATSTDLLTDGERHILRAMRPKRWRDAMKARSTAIRGR